MNSHTNPMLLTVFNSSIFNGATQPWYVSEKYDGWRMLYNHTTRKFFTRNGNIITLPQVFYDAIDSLNLPEDTILDGELWCGYNSFNDVTTVIANQYTESIKAKYMVFDMPHTTQTFEQRYTALQGLLNKHESSCIQLVTQTRVTAGDMTSVDIMMKDVCVNKNGEGLVFREPSQMYVYNTRCTSFLKLKKFDTTEATVISHNLTAKAASSEVIDYVSSITCQLVEDVSKEFKLSWRGVDPPPVNSIITIKYSQHTINGLPKFPTYVGIRSGMDFDAKSKNAPKPCKPRKPRLPGITKKTRYINRAGTPNPEFTKTIDEWMTCQPDIEPGTCVWIKAPRSNYKVTAPKNGGPLYCSCAAWLYQKLPAALRSCKHCRLFNKIG